VRLLAIATGRLRTWWRALLAPAPDPRQPLADAVVRQRDLLRRVRRARIDLATARRQIESRVFPMLETTRALEERGRQSLMAGREDLARLALERRWSVARELGALEDQARELGQDEERLALVEERLASWITAFDARQQTLAARTSAADAQARIAEELADVSSGLGGIGPALDEAERRAERSQARAAAIERLVEDGSLELLTPGGPALSPGMAELERTRAIDEQLSALRREQQTGDQTS
jgi:phage shock protein A